MRNKCGWRPRPPRYARGRCPHPPRFAPASPAFFGAGSARTHLASRVGSARTHLASRVGGARTHLASRLLQPHSSGGGPSNAALAHKVPLPVPCRFVRAEGPPKLTWHSGLPEAGTRRSDFGEVFADRDGETQKGVPMPRNAGWAQKKRRDSSQRMQAILIFGGQGSSGVTSMSRKSSASQETRS